MLYWKSSSDQLFFQNQSVDQTASILRSLSFRLTRKGLGSRTGQSDLLSEKKVANSVNCFCCSCRILVLVTWIARGNTAGIGFPSLTFNATAVVDDSTFLRLFFLNQHEHFLQRQHFYNNTALLEWKRIYRTNCTLVNKRSFCLQQRSWIIKLSIRW